MSTIKEFFVVKHKGKFLTGHSYATGFGYSYSWSRHVSEARLFKYDEHAQAPKGSKEINLAKVIL